MENSKFASVFLKTGDNKKPVSKALLKLLNKEVPDGYSYQLMEGTTDMYVLRKKGESNENSFIIRIKFPLMFEGMAIHDLDELTEAIYRTQKPFKLDESLQTNPPTIIHLASSGKTTQFIGPVDDLPNLEPLEVEIGEKKITIPIKRVPHASLTEIKVISDENHLINLELTIDEHSKKMKFTVNINYDKLRTIDDYFMNIDLIHPFFTDGIKIFNKVLKPEKDAIKLFKNNLNFLESLKQIQTYFSVSFDFPQKIDKDDVYFAKVLFESFINNRMVAIKNQNKIRFSFEKDKFDPTKHHLEDGTEIGVVNPTEMTLEMLGAKLQFLEYKVYPSMTFEKITDDKDDEINIIFDLPSESKHYIIYSLDSIGDFEMATKGQELLNMVDSAIDINDVDFSF